MELVMILEEKAVDANALAPHLWNDEAYVEGAKQGMLEKHAAAIDKAGEAPLFYIEGVSSCINGFQSLLTRSGMEAVDELISEVVYPSRVKRYKE